MQPAPQPPQLAAILLVAGLLWMCLGAWVWAFLRFLAGRSLLPGGPRRVPPWGGFSVALVVASWIVSNLIVPVAYITIVKIFQPDIAPESLSPTDQLILTMFVNLVFIAIGPRLLASGCGLDVVDLGLIGEQPAVQVIRGVVAWPLLAPIVFGSMYLAVGYFGKSPHPVEKLIGGDASAISLLISTLSGVVFAPLAEEFLFRGVLLGWLDRNVLLRRLVRDSETKSPHFEDAEVWTISEEDLIDSSESSPSILQSVPREVARLAGPGLLFSNVLVSLVFAGLHMAQWPAPIPLFFLSLGLGVLRQRTDSLVGPIALHVTFNGISTLMLFLTQLRP